MGISYLDDLLEGLKTEMEQMILPGTFYDTRPTIARGLHYWEDTKGKRPFIWFINSGGEFEETLSNTTVDSIVIEIHGFADREGKDNNNMHQLFKDVVYFLMNDYSQPVNLISYVMDEGGINKELNQSGFLLYVKVITDFDITTMQ